MDHYHFYLVLPETNWDDSVPAHWGLPVTITYPKSDGNRDIIFGGWNLDVNGNPTTWRRPTWREAAVGVPGVHGAQLGPRAVWTYTYPGPTTLRWGITKFVHPHLPRALPEVSGGHGLFSLFGSTKLSDTVTPRVESTIQALIDDQTAFYTDARALLEWADAESLAGNLDKESA